MRAFQDSMATDQAPSPAAQTHGVERDGLQRLIAVLKTKNFWLTWPELASGLAKRVQIRGVDATGRHGDPQAFVPLGIDRPVRKLRLPRRYKVGAAAHANIHWPRLAGLPRRGLGLIMGWPAPQQG
jgi:hypothetical protein